MKANIPEKKVKELLELLNLEYQFYCDLEKLLIEERNALVALDNDELTNINYSKESLLINIIEVKNKRTELLKEIGELLSVNPEDINLSFLSSNLPEYSNEFTNFKNKFKQIGKQIKSLNEINKHVINSSLNFIKSSLNIVFQGSNKAVYTNYGKVAVHNKAMTHSTYSQRV